MIALIDGDMVAHRCAASCHPTKKKAAELGIPIEELKNEPEYVAIGRADELMYRILNSCSTSKYRVFISGSDNFRHRLCKDYKANRAHLPRPEHLDACRNFLVREWGAEITAGYEADDGIGIAAKENFIIVSNDKDFRQIAGEHYNPVTDEFETVGNNAAALAFWSSVLMGDKSDNIRGIDRIGPVTARRILGDADPEEYETIVRRCYGDDERFLLVYRLLRILRSEEEYAEIEAAISEGQGKESTKTSP
ncbi:MAG: hypothetical protein QXL01_04745 [Thermoplasmatales archaeon]